MSDEDAPKNRVLQYCTVCGTKVPSYDPGKFSLEEAFDYPGTQEVTDSDLYDCPSCKGKLPAMSLTDTADECPGCGNPNPIAPAPRFCAWCGAARNP